MIESRKDSENYYCASDSCCETHLNIKQQRDKVTLGLLPNTKENRRRLRAGYGYIVKFYDVDVDSEGLAVAMWTGYKFKYFDGRFIHGGEPLLVPPPEKTVYNRVTGFFRLVDWRRDEKN